MKMSKHIGIQRRDRTKRTPNGKSIRLVDRDFEIFKLLYRYSMLDSKTLIQFIKPLNEKRFIDRLGHLYHDGLYLDRPKGQWNHYQARYSPVVHSLSPRGYKALTNESRLSERVYIDPNHDSPARLQFKHSLRINQALAKFELDCLSKPNESFVPVEEILNNRNVTTSIEQHHIGFNVEIPRSEHNRGPVINTKIIPDALFGIEYKTDDKSQYKFFAIEVEHKSPPKRTTLKLTSSFKKILAYKAAITSRSYKAELAIPIMFPIFILNDYHHHERVTQLAENLLTQKEQKLFSFIIL